MGGTIGTIGSMLQTFNTKEIDRHPCISDSVRLSVSIPWIAVGIRVHINKARFRPLSLYIRFRKASPWCWKWSKKTLETL